MPSCEHTAPPRCMKSVQEGLSYFIILKSLRSSWFLLAVAPLPAPSVRSSLDTAAKHKHGSVENGPPPLARPRAGAARPLL